MFGLQREEVWRAGGYPDELYAMYLLRPGYGMGRSLMRASCAGSGPFTACVIAGNSRAFAFYEKSGGQHLLTRQERIGQNPITERVYRWDAPPFGV